MHTHSHNHHHHHAHAVSPKVVAGRAFKIGIVLNLIFVLIEVVAGLEYNSLALLTDAGHNLSDVASLALSLLAFNMARQRATPLFTYGYKKTTILAALANAVMLLIAVGIMSYESILRLIRPQEVAGDVVAWIAGAGILVNGISAFLFFKDKEKDLNIKSAYLHLAADALVSLGVVAAGIIILFTGWYWVDSVMGLTIALVILLGTWKLLIESFKLSVDAVPSGIRLDDITKVMLTTSGVTNVRHIHIWPLSTTENALTAHITINEALSFEQKMQVVKDLRHQLFHHNLHHCTLEVESADDDTKKEPCFE